MTQGTSMAFTTQQLQKFVHLIHLDVSAEQLADMKIDSVIDWLDKLQKIDTTGVEPMLTPAEHDAPMRDDVVTDGNMRDAVLANVPDTAGKSRGYFAVPKIMDED
jgi:aspartyl-tRNA(Asn)/glutamyl-tRNA(Gln) amidotransferase subunit C